jgi:ATP adenylyltransferase
LLCVFIYFYPDFLYDRFGQQMSDTKPCLFCDAYVRGDEVVWQNDYFFASFDRFPVNPGHALIIPRRHVKSIMELTGTEWQFMQSAGWRIWRLIESTDFVDVYRDMLKNPINKSSERFCRHALFGLEGRGKPTGYNVGINEGESAGRTIDHLHVHVIPRYADEIPLKGGVRNVILGQGYY